jgi:acetyl-CoA C-acetyltransferase
MKEAVITSIARTPIGKAYRGSLNATCGATLGAHAIRAAIDRAGVSPEEIDDVVIGGSWNEGTTGANIGRQVVLRSGLPAKVPGMTVNRYCSTGLQTVVLAAQQVIAGQSQIVAAGGLESITLVENEHMNTFMARDPWLLEHKPAIFMSMIETAEVVAERYGVNRESQDEYSLQSQQRTAAGQEAGHYAEEIVPITTTMRKTDRETGEATMVEVEFGADECNRPSTTAEGLAGLKPVIDGGSITAGNASQLSDGAAAVVVMDAATAEARGIEPLGAFRDFVVAGCEPDEMGIGPVFAVPRLLERNGMTIDDIDLWELNEAFAVQTIYCRDRLGIPDERLNVDGGAVSIGHPYGMSGTRMVGHALLRGRARGVRWVVVTMCVGGGMGAAGLIEVL